MSYDGVSGDVDNTANVPENLYDEHLYILNGNSSFKRTIGKSNDSIVYESLYVRNSTAKELNTRWFGGDAEPKVEMTNENDNDIQIY